MNRTVLVLLLAFACAACGPSGTSDSTGGAAPDSVATQAATPASKSAKSASAAPAETKPQFREVTIPSGTALHVKLTSAVASDTSKTEDAVRGELSQPIVVDDATVVPAGTAILGAVLAAVRSGRVEGRASIAIGFDRLSVGNQTHPIRTARITEEAQSTRREDVKKVGIGAGAGAVVGAIAGGKKGAAVGSAIGAGAGTGVVVATRGDEVRLPAGTAVTTTLQAPLTIQVPLR